MERTGARGAGAYYLMCERRWVYHLLMAAAGIFGAYTYLLRGGVFCNAQTGNVVLMGMALGAGDWRGALYYLIPICAYLLGAFVSELLPNPVKHRLPIRWDTLFIAVEMLFVAALGLLPDDAPVQISQVTVNFIASMQYNTFRQAEGLPMATTFATNHIRQIGVGLAAQLRHHGSGSHTQRTRLVRHLEMLACFLLGAVAGTVLCRLCGGRAIWGALPLLAVILAALLRADLVEEKDLLEQKPAGH